MSTRDEMRSKLLASVPRKRKTVTVKGVEFELLQPLVKEREEFTKHADNGTEFVAHAVIAMAVVPGTEERLFEDSDIATFRNEVIGGVLDQVGEEIANFVQVTQDEKKD